MFAVGANADVGVAVKARDLVRRDRHRVRMVVDTLVAIGGAARACGRRRLLIGG